MSNKIIIPVTDTLVMPALSKGDQRTEVEVALPDSGAVSDGWHTFDELYHYRMLYNAGMANTLASTYVGNGLGHDIEVVKSWRHGDGELCFGKDNYFVVVMQQVSTGICLRYQRSSERQNGTATHHSRQPSGWKRT